MMGLAYERNGQPEEAVATYERARDETGDPGSTIVLYTARPERWLTAAFD